MQSLKSIRPPQSEVPEFNNLFNAKKGGSSMMMNRGSSQNVRKTNMSQNEPSSTGNRNSVGSSHSNSRSKNPKIGTANEKKNQMV